MQYNALLLEKWHLMEEESSEKNVSLIGKEKLRKIRMSTMIKEGK